MKKEDCFYLGKIVRKYSYKGELVIKLDTDEPELYENLEYVFLDMKKNFVPYFIEESILQKGNQLRVRFEDVENEHDADRLLKTDVYLPLEFLPKLTGNQFYYHEIIGFELEDKEFGKVGEIVSVNEHTAQPLFVVMHKNTEVLIPMVDDFIKEIDRNNKKILVDTPKGLIDMYLES